MTFANSLKLLEEKSAYPKVGQPTKRWGQIIREDPSLTDILAECLSNETITSLSDLGSVKSGVVTRANAYFLVRELPFSEIPGRFHVTRRDMKRVAVAMDGLQTPFKIERKYLRKVAKGPETLLSPSEVEATDIRLFDVTSSKQDLKTEHSTGALAYIKRGETISYDVSDDSLKGGIPAERSQIKNRKPHWYSLGVPAISCPRIALPEHIDRRYIATLLQVKEGLVVIDTLYVFTPSEPPNAEFICVSLNTLLTAYQLELRGRTQHGEGVLKIKIPDFNGVLILDPASVSKRDKQKLLKAFRKFNKARVTDSLESFSNPERVAFDELYLEICGWPNPDQGRLDLERAIRALAGERKERKDSVAGAKKDRKKATGLSASVDAYASRLASKHEPFPDPRQLVSARISFTRLALLEPVDGKLSVGVELFDQGKVFSGDKCICQASSNLAARYVHGVLLHDPELEGVDVPEEPALSKVIEGWEAAIEIWRRQFDEKASTLIDAINDPRLKDSIIKRALELLHAE